MRMQNNITALAIMSMLVLFTAANSFSQGRQGRGNGHDRKGNDHHQAQSHSPSHNDHNDHHNGGHQHHDNHHDYHSTAPSRVHYDHRPDYHRTYVRRDYYAAPTPWVHVHNHYYPANRRYVYFRDYNVYYDCTRDVYVSLSGGRWIFTAQMPVMMQQVPVERVIYTDVDYCGDDIVYYHNHRPGVSVNVGVVIR